MGGGILQESRVTTSNIGHEIDNATNIRNIGDNYGIASNKPLADLACQHIYLCLVILLN